MIRLSALFWLVLVSATGLAMFAVKYEVEALADELAHTAKQADDAARDIRVFEAEWAYLNQPDALAQMNQRHLSLAPIATKQLVASLTDIPMRPAPPPPPPPIQLAAAAAEISPASSAPPGPSLPPAGQPTEGQLAEGQPSTPAGPAPNRTPAEAAALATHAAAPAPAKPVLIKAALRPSPTHRAKSLDELIAQIAESR